MISGPGGQATYTGPAPQTAWATYTAPINASSWTVNSGTWDAILKDVTSVKIRIEGVLNTANGALDVDGIDNVRLQGTGVAEVTHRVQISVGNSGQVYVGIVNGSPSQPGVERWRPYTVRAMGERPGRRWICPRPSTAARRTRWCFRARTPPPAIHWASCLAGQGTVDFSIVADPTNVNLVYIGGYSQISIGTNSAIGAGLYGRAVPRRRLEGGRLAVGPSDQSNTKGASGGGTASSSAPHAQSRDMVFDASGRFIEADAGGVYVRTSPDQHGRLVVVERQLAVTEVESVAYDTISNVVIAGAKTMGSRSKPPTATPRGHRCTPPEGDGGVWRSPPTTPA